jgi:hypothetical protein
LWVLTGTMGTLRKSFCVGMSRVSLYLSSIRFSPPGKPLQAVNVSLLLSCSAQNLYASHRSHPPTANSSPSLHLSLNILDHLLRLPLSLRKCPLNLLSNLPSLPLKIPRDLLCVRPAPHVPVCVPAGALRGLRAEVDDVASEEEVVFGLDGERVSHECAGVEHECRSETAGDAVREG